MAFPDTAELESIVAPVAVRHGLDVEAIKTVKAGKKSQVTIAISGDEAPTLDQLEDISNEVSLLFDEAEERGELNFGAGYTLEVTTPGIDLPLTLPRHWRRNRGRVVAVRFGEGMAPANGGKDGTLYRIGAVNSDDTEVVLVSHAEKGRKHTPRAIAVRFDQVENAVVEIEFGKPNEAELALANAEFTQLTDDNQQDK
ncbi:ribosome maturation factor RimP [Corynebacterium aquatimens]|uniref:Ribosome maturation factor RimP n=1 Tax=Corynebacterium aquatimens TaxID=1190508 RepID=A0A931DZD8_9CORY|nr:ribosome maturation factor RimP [Corynebacterium aquatimens]MBG6121849.1 ribosome maturation factor RimP [Corynebacterium aquatimens]WJY65613.1 ribosome maturation protein RimP [Corynebacterium aquatimens]